MTKRLIDQISEYRGVDLPIATEIDIISDSHTGEPPRFRLFSVVFSDGAPTSLRVRLEPLAIPEQGEYFRVYSDSAADNFDPVEIETRFTSSRENLIGRVAHMGVQAQPPH